MTLAAITEAHVVSLQAHLARELGVAFVRKEQRVEMRLLAAALDAAHEIAPWLLGMTGAAWMERYATTIGTICYVPGTWSPADRFCVSVHEAQHGVQWARGSATDLPRALGMAWLYLVAPEARARYEADADRGTLETLFLIEGDLPPLEPTVARFEGYHLGEHLTLLSDLMEIAGTQVHSTRSPSTAAGQSVERWLRVHPELRAERA
jgi:hypothetical protein